MNRNEKLAVYNYRSDNKSDLEKCGYNGKYVAILGGFSLSGSKYIA